MVADDEADIAALLAEVLTSGGHTVHTAADGRAAAEQIVRLRPDLSILDHYMPEMTGLRVAELLRADPATSSLPLLMLSAAAPPTALLYCNVVLAKPVSIKHLTTVVDELLRPARPSDPVRDLDRIRAAGVLLDLHTAATGARLAQFARELAEEVGAGMAAVSVVLMDAVALCGSYGLSGWIQEAGGTPAEWTPCTNVIREGKPLIVGDLTTHPEYAGSPLGAVTGVRSYAGIPLTDHAGHLVGTLSVMDRRPQAFAGEVVDRLRERSAEAVAKLYQ